VRLVVCWEALEPREIGVYDEEYITYVYMLVQKAYEAGLSVFIDGHQDVVRDHPNLLIQMIRKTKAKTGKIDR
jgi:hypothetical protein